jgi:hypothetical protein
MTDHTENQKLFALGKAIYGDDEIKHWEFRNPRGFDMWSSFGSGKPPEWLEYCEYHRKSDAPKLPDGYCDKCHVDDGRICETCDAVNAAVGKKSNPQQIYVLCCDCIVLDKDRYCPETCSTMNEPYIQGCKMGTPKPKMRSITVDGEVLEFPAPVKEVYKNSSFGFKPTLDVERGKEFFIVRINENLVEGVNHSNETETYPGPIDGTYIIKIKEFRDLDSSQWRALRLGLLQRTKEGAEAQIKAICGVSAIGGKVE